MQKIAVLTQSRSTRRQIARALGSGGLDPVFFDAPEALATALGSLAPALIIIDTATISAAEAQPLLQQQGAAHPSRPVVLLAVAENEAKSLELLRAQALTNLVAQHGAIRAASPTVDERELLVTCQKVLRRDIFGLEKYLGLWGARVERFTLKSMEDKAPLLQDFEAYLQRLDCPARVIPEIATVAEELVLNAMVHAPRDERGVPKYEAGGPRADLALDPDEEVEVSWACDGRRLLLSVSDRFGALSRNTVLDYLSRGLGGEKRRVETKAGGAGLGMSMAFNGLHQLIFNVQDKVRTEAIAGWHLRADDAREFRTTAKSLNLFWLPTDARPLAGDEPGRDARSEEPSSKATQAGQVLHLSGRIDEVTDFSGIGQVSVLELSKVDAFTSQGVLKWMAMLDQLSGRRVELAGCPEPLVRLASEVTGLLSGLRVTSVMCPHSCAACRSERVLELAPDEVMKGAQKCEVCGAALTFEGTVHHYRAFLEAAAQENHRG